MDNVARCWPNKAELQATQHRFWGQPQIRHYIQYFGRMPSCMFELGQIMQRNQLCSGGSPWQVCFIGTENGEWPRCRHKCSTIGLRHFVTRMLMRRLSCLLTMRVWLSNFFHFTYYFWTTHAEYSRADANFSTAIQSLTTSTQTTPNISSPSNSTDCRLAWLL